MQPFNTSVREGGLIWSWLSQVRSISAGSIVLTVWAVVLIPFIITSLYRIYVHPLRHVPGPRLGALTELYGFYWNWIRGEGYSKSFNSMHKQYSTTWVAYT